MKCVYCELPEIKERIVVENDLAFSFPTNIPIVPGHLLIAPKRCVAKYEELSSDEKNSIEDLRIKLKGALEKSFGAQ